MRSAVKGGDEWTMGPLLLAALCILATTSGRSDAHLHPPVPGGGAVVCLPKPLSLPYKK